MSRIWESGKPGSCANSCGNGHSDCTRHIDRLVYASSNKQLKVYVSANINGTKVMKHLESAK